MKKLYGPKFQKKIFYYVSLVLALTGMMMTSSQIASSATLSVTRRVVIPIDMTPREIRRNGDGNYVVVGSILDSGRGIPMAAGAVKLSPDGQVLWQYTSPFVNPRKYPSVGQNYFSSVEMPDASTFMCGSLFDVPQIGLKKNAILLTHLDSNGGVLGEQPFILDDHEYSMGECFRWGSGVAVIGGFGGMSASEPLPGSIVWLFDERGKLLWKRRFAQSDGIGGHLISGGYLYLLSEKSQRNLADPRLPGKEFGELTILRISLQGELEVANRVPGFLGDWGKIAYPAIPSGSSDIYMVGVSKPGEYTSKNPHRLVVRFDSSLHEVSRIQTTLPAPPVTFQRVFSQPDGSLFYFGSVSRGGDGSPHMGVAYTDPMFSKQAEVAMAAEDFEDFPQVEVATSTGELNHFVAVNRLVVRGFKKDPIKASEKFPPSTTAGIYLVLQFLELTN